MFDLDGGWPERPTNASFMLGVRFGPLRVVVRQHEGGLLDATQHLDRRHIWPTGSTCCRHGSSVPDVDPAPSASHRSHRLTAAHRRDRATRGESGWLACPSVHGEDGDVGRDSGKRGWTSLSDEQRKGLIAGGIVVLLFPFFWPAGFWANLAAAFVAGGLAYAATLAIVRGRNRDHS